MFPCSVREEGSLLKTGRPPSSSSAARGEPGRLGEGGRGGEAARRGGRETKSLVGQGSSQGGAPRQGRGGYTNTLALKSQPNSPEAARARQWRTPSTSCDASASGSLRGRRLRSAPDRRRRDASSGLASASRALPCRSGAMRSTPASRRRSGGAVGGGGRRGALLNGDLGESTKGDLNVRRRHLDALGCIVCFQSNDSAVRELTSIVTPCLGHRQAKPNND